MTAPRLAEVEALIPPNLKYDKASGRAGLRALPGRGGVYVAAFNARGEQVRFNATQRRWIEQTVAVLYPRATAGGAVIGRNGERQRTVIGMKSRLRHLNSLPPGTVLALESLDTRPIPTNPDALTPDNHRNFSRATTWIVTAPSPARRYIALSEFPIKIDGKTKAPDEVFVSYVVGDDELQKVKDPGYGGFRTLDDLEARNLSVHVGDPNLELTEGAARQHFTKTNTYLAAVLEKLTTEWNIRPLDAVTCSAKDVYLNQDLVKLSAPRADTGHGASAVKILNQLDPETGRSTGRNSVLYMAAMFLRETKPDGSVQWVHQTPETSVIGRLAKTGMKSFIDNLASTDVIPRLLKALPR